MAQASRDENLVTTLLGVSSSDGVTPVTLYADPTTHRLLTSASGGAAPADATFVTLSTNATLTNERVLTGTANQITITDNGAGSTVVLSLPQSIATSSTPTFASMTLTGASSLTLGTASTNTGAIILKNSTNANNTVLQAGAAGAALTFTLPTTDGNNGEFLQTDGNGVMSWAAGAAGANTALSNLASVAINTALLPDAAAADDFGSATLPFKDIFLAGSSGTPGTNNFRLTGASTSGTRVITLPDATDTLMGKATTDTMTNKTFDTAGAGNSFSINGTAITAVTGTGSAVLATSPTLVTPAIGAATGTSLVLTGNLSAEDLLIEDSDASHYLTITTTSNLTATRTLTLVPGDADRTVTLAGNLNISGDLITSGDDSLTFTIGGATNVTLPTTGTLATLAGTEELDNKTLDSSVLKGTFTASGTVTLPAVTLGDTVLVGGGASATEVRFLEPSGSGTNYTALKAQAQGANITYTLPAAVGAAGTFLTDAAGNGTLSWAATASGGSKVKIDTAFETAARFSAGANGSGSNTFNTLGYLAATSTTISSRASIVFYTDPSQVGTWQGYGRLPKIGIIANLNTAPTSDNPQCAMVFGEITASGAGFTFTERHFGFKIVRQSGANNLIATQADGTTETVSSALTTVVAGDTIEVYAEITSSTNCDYYWRKNGGAMSSATTLTTNLPGSTDTTGASGFTLGVSNVGTTSPFSVAFSSAFYER